MASSGLVISRIQGATVVNFQNTAILDGAAVQSLGEDLYRLVDQQALTKVILDFTSVRFLSSTMLGVLITLQRKATAIKGRVILCGLRTELLKVFRITKLDTLLEFADNEQDALLKLHIFPAG